MVKHISQNIYTPVDNFDLRGLNAEVCFIARDVPEKQYIHMPSKIWMHHFKTSIEFGTL
jgi:hypothetical protein